MIHTFDNYDAIDFNTTTIEERRKIHKLYEQVIGKVTVRTEIRDKLKSTHWNAHFFVYDKTLRALSTSSDVKNLKFHPFEWWMNKLNGKKYFDNSAQSPTDTHLDKQLEFLNKKNAE